MIEQHAEVIFNDPVAADTCLMGLKSREIAARAHPGQFVMVRVGPHADPLLRRPFSICGVWEQDCFLILYRVVGRGTRMMADAGSGDGFGILGPLGTGFDFPEQPEGSLLVAGGMGIAPLGFLAGRMDRDMHLLAGYGSIDQQIPVHALGLSPGTVLTATEDGSAGHHGRVTDLLEETLKRSPPTPTRVYACGPTPMLKAVAGLILNRGVFCQVSLESTMACGLGACQGCAVPAAPGRDRKYYHVCQDGPVFDIGAIDWEQI
ncbi:MAG: dihydroorotate dehydrogenase electron transfer subunit [Desulfatiglandaceae bacterium]